VTEELPTGTVINITKSSQVEVERNWLLILNGSRFLEEGTNSKLFVVRWVVSSYIIHKYDKFRLM